jgi:hypothetical protein
MPYSLLLSNDRPKTLLFTITHYLAWLCAQRAGLCAGGDFITVRPELKYKSVTADEDNK